MSTNKRKEAAALFELLDKSTLKVPKSAGALKIPSWWASKTNPAPAPMPDLPELPEPPAASAALANAPTSPQHRLFDPPPADAHPASSPSIRPPAPTAVATNGTPTQPTVRIASRPIIKAPTAEPETPRPAPRPAPRPEPAIPPGRRVFAPQTVDQNAAARRHFMGSQKRAVARTPRWVIGAGIVGIAFVLLLLILILFHHPHTPSTNLPAAPNVDLPPQSPSSYSQQRGSSQPLTPTNGSGALLPPKQIVPTTPPTPPQNDEPPPEPVTQGKVYGPSVIQHDPKLYYIIIASTDQKTIAIRNADFIAKNGVDVSIETLTGPHGRGTLFTLISVEGFPTLREAEALRKRIVQIGHKTPDFQKSHRAWDDAYATHVRPAAPAK